MIYLDHAGLGIPREDALRQEYEYKLALSKDPSLEYKYSDIIEKNKKYLCRDFFKTSKYMLSYVRNATEAITITTNVIPLSDGDEVITSSLEHRSADNSWEYACKKKNAVLKKVKIEPHDKASVIVEKYKKAITDKTKVIFCSHVDRNFGIVFPVEELSRIAKENNCYLIIDGAQAVGLIDMNLDDIDCSIYICSFHKWCRMPVAIGAMLVNNEIAHKLGRLYVGEKRLEEESVEDKDFGTDELGTRNVALEMCIPLLLDPKSSNNTSVFEYFLDRLEAISNIVEVVSYIHRNGRGFIVVDMIDNNENLQDLFFDEYGIMIGRIKKDEKIYLRFSFDTFTQKNEIHLLIEAIKDVARSAL